MPERIPPGQILRIPLAWLRPVPAEAVPVAVEAPAQVRQGGGTWGPLAQGTALTDGDAIATGPEGSVTLRLADGSRVLIPGATTVVKTACRYHFGLGALWGYVPGVALQSSPVSGELPPNL